jgi:hypothetical protein
METTETPVQTAPTPPTTNGNGDAPEAATPVPETSPAEEQTVEQMFQYARWVHVGEGAVECEDRENGSCGDPFHFHSWCRLPNPFQQESIREKALAAKARKMRQLRDPGTDVYEILEAEMDQLRRIADSEASKEILVDDLLQQSYWKDHLTAVRETNEEEAFSSIREDANRFQHLHSLPEDQRPKDEYEELERHIAEYDKKVGARREEIQKPQREALMSQEPDALIKQIRDTRIDSEGNDDFMRVYNQWQIFIGTLRPRDPEKGLPNERVFGSVEHLRDSAPPEVVQALQDAFQEMETALGARGAVGNS